MSSKQRIYQFLNIKEGEEKAVSIFTSYSFFMGIAIAMYYTASTSLFLINYKDIRMLPVAYIAGGIFIFALGRLVNKLQKHLKYSYIAVSLISFLIVSVFLLIWLHIKTGNIIFSFLLFIWIRVFVFVNGMSFWASASRIFDLSQAKRLFSFISTGEVISSIISFFSVPVLLKFVPTDNILFISIVSLFACMVLMVYITNHYKDRLSYVGSKNTKDKENTDETSRQIVSKKYYLFLFLLALLPVFGLYYTEFIFFIQSRATYTNKETLAGFLGIFFGFCAIIEFLLKTVLYSRIMKNYGLKFGITILPFTLILSFSLAAMYGIFAGMATMFFSFIILSRFFMSSVRKSISEPSFQLLFQPIPDNLRISLQGRIEGGPKALGNLLAGVIILLLTIIPNITLAHFCFAFLFILIFWSQIALKVQTAYRDLLRRNISYNSQKDESKTSSHNYVSLFSDLLLKTKTENLSSIIQAIEIIDPADEIKIYSNVFLQVCFEKKLIILQRVKEIVPMIFKNLILEYLEIIKEEEDASLFLKTRKILLSARKMKFEKIEKLAHSGNSAERKKACYLLGQSNRYHASGLLHELMQDWHDEVKTAAIVSAGIMRKEELWPALIEFLDTNNYWTFASSALRLIGEPVLKSLNNAYDRAGSNIALQLRIIILFGEIGSEQAVKFLRKRLKTDNIVLRDKIVSELYYLGYHASGVEKSLLNQAIDEIISSLAWHMAAKEDLSGKKCPNLQEALQEAISYQIQNLMFYLGVLFNKSRIEIIKKNLQVESRDMRAYLLEIIHITLPDDIKQKLIPLLEDNTNKDKLRKINEFYPQYKLNFPDRLIDILNKDYRYVSPWIKVLAIKEIYHEKPTKKNLSRIIAAQAYCNDLLIRETALCYLSAIDESKYNKLIEVIKPSNYLKIYKFSSGFINVKNNNELFIKILKIKKNPFFEGIYDGQAIRLTVLSKALKLKTNETLNFFDDYADENFFLLVLAGEIQILLSDVIDKILYEGQLIFIDNESDYRYATGNAKMQTELIFVPTQLVFQMLAENKTLLNNFLTELYLTGTQRHRRLLSSRHKGKIKN